MGGPTLGESAVKEVEVSGGAGWCAGQKQLHKEGKREKEKGRGRGVSGKREVIKDILLAPPEFCNCPYCDATRLGWS